MSLAWPLTFYPVMPLVVSHHTQKAEKPHNSTNQTTHTPQQQKTCQLGFELCQECGGCMSVHLRRQLMPLFSLAHAQVAACLSMSTENVNAWHLRTHQSMYNSNDWLNFIKHIEPSDFKFFMVSNITVFPCAIQLRRCTGIQTWAVTGEYYYTSILQ